MLAAVKIGTIQRRLAWPLRKNDTHKSRSVNNGTRRTESPMTGWRKGGGGPRTPQAGEPRLASQRFMLEHVRSNGQALRYAAPRHKADRESMLKAVKRHGQAPIYAAPRHKADRESF